MEMRCTPDSCTYTAREINSGGSRISWPGAGGTLSHQIRDLENDEKCADPGGARVLPAKRKGGREEKKGGRRRKKRGELRRRRKKKGEGKEEKKGGGEGKKGRGI